MTPRNSFKKLCFFQWYVIFEYFIVFSKVKDCRNCFYKSVISTLLLCFSQPWIQDERVVEEATQKVTMLYQNYRWETGYLRNGKSLKNCWPRFTWGSMKGFMIIRCVQMVPVRGFQRQLSNPWRDLWPDFQLWAQSNINGLGFAAKVLFQKVFQMRFTCVWHTLKLEHIYISKFSWCKINYYLNHFIWLLFLYYALWKIV